MGKYHKGIRIEGAEEFLLAVNITGHGAPTEDTEAEPGMCYLDEDSENGDLYKCIGMLVTETGTVYRWKKLAGQEEVERLSEAIGDKADKAGWMPNKYIGTDAEGNIIEKDDPTGGDGWTIDGLTAETVIADDDAVPFYDTSAKGQRKTLWGNIKAVLKTYFDGVYLKLSGGILTGKIVLPTDNQNVGFTNGGDVKIFGYGNIDSVSHLRIGDATRPVQLRGSAERPKYNDGELVLKSEFDTVMQAYIDDIAELVGGDA